MVEDAPPPPSIEMLPLGSLRPSARNARRHSRRQVRQIAASIEEFGFTNPILVAGDNEIVAGHGRVAAARLLKLEGVPAIRLDHLTPMQRRAYLLADNKLALNSSWDIDVLAAELEALVDLDFDVTTAGFSLAEVDLALDTKAERRTATAPAGGDPDALPAPPERATTRPGDLWLLGRHRLLCGDARNAGDCDRLMAGEMADLIFTDPPYNNEIDAFATGHGGARHREFAMASGEMTPEAYTAFLSQSLSAMAGHARDGAIAFVFTDWRHMLELQTAAGPIFSEMKNLCIWNKANAGLGTFYRSKHELVFVFKVGTADHVNTFGLGGTGRYRTNVWDYAGVNSLGAGRAEALAMHPTAKPVALVADAIKDCTRRGGIVLDAFGGSGSTLIAAEACGRAARLMEIDPPYCDVIIRRFEQFTGRPATLEGSGDTFEAVGEARHLEVQT